VTVHLAAVTATTKVIIDRALYLPADWAADEERREVAGVPEEIAFATKPQQALAMVTDAFAAGLKATGSRATRCTAGANYAGAYGRWGSARRWASPPPTRSSTGPDAGGRPAK